MNIDAIVEWNCPPELTSYEAKQLEDMTDRAERRARRAEQRARAAENERLATLEILRAPLAEEIVAEMNRRFCHAIAPKAEPALKAWLENFNVSMSVEQDHRDMTKMMTVSIWSEPFRFHFCQRIADEALRVDVR